jgi:uncharacterized damage-inducible protein DinB
MGKIMTAYPVLETIYRHNLWANLQLLAACASLTDEQLQASIVGGFGSIEDTLQHFVRSERGYFTRISTGQPFQHPAAAPLLTFAEMGEWLTLSGEGLIAWAAKVQADDVVELLWENAGIRELTRVPKAVILTQAINHATEHRAQIMAIMTQLGVEPPSLDSWTFF